MNMITHKSWLLSLTIVILFANACKANDKSNQTKDPQQKEKSNKSSDTLLYKIREAKGTEKPVLVVLMHGFGADDSDLLPLAESFPENYLVVTPQGPYQIGSTNYQWYISEKAPDGSLDGNHAEIDSSITKITVFVKKLQQKYQISPQSTFIGGFSQGANMSYELGLRDPSLFKGLGILSGTIFNSLKKDYKQKKADSLQIFIGHGDADNRIPYALAVKSKEWLIAHQYKPEFHTYKGMTHAISPEEVNDFLQFIQKNTKNG